LIVDESYVRCYASLAGWCFVRATTPTIAGVRLAKSGAALAIFRVLSPSLHTERCVFDVRALDHRAGGTRTRTEAYGISNGKDASCDGLDSIASQPEQSIALQPNHTIMLQVSTTPQQQQQQQPASQERGVFCKSSILDFDKKLDNLAIAVSEESNYITSTSTSTSISTSTSTSTRADGKKVQTTRTVRKMRRKKVLPTSETTGDDLCMDQSEKTTTTAPLSPMGSQRAEDGEDGDERDNDGVASTSKLSTEEEATNLAESNASPETLRSRTLRKTVTKEELQQLPIGLRMSALGNASHRTPSLDCRGSGKSHNNKATVGATSVSTTIKADARPRFCRKLKSPSEQVKAAKQSSSQQPPNKKTNKVLQSFQRQVDAQEQRKFEGILAPHQRIGVVEHHTSTNCAPFSPPAGAQQLQVKIVDQIPASLMFTLGDDLASNCSTMTPSVERRRHQHYGNDSKKEQEKMSRVKTAATAVAATADGTDTTKKLAAWQLRELFKQADSSPHMPRRKISVVVSDSLLFEGLS
jgi:hypothetical protein